MNAKPKKYLNIALWAATVISALLFWRFATDLLYDTWSMVFGEATFVGKHCVVYEKPGCFLYTNPVAMVKWRIIIGLSIMLVSLIAAAATFPLLKRSYRHYRRVVYILWMLLLWLGCFGIYAAVARRYDNFFAELEKCTRIEDYERLMGTPLRRKVVVPGDREKIEALANFRKSGFAPGRELVVFSNGNPHVLILVWRENGDIAHVDWCYKNSENTIR